MVDDRTDDDRARLFWLAVFVLGRILNGMGGSRGRSLTPPWRQSSSIGSAWPWLTPFRTTCSTETAIPGRSRRPHHPARAACSRHLGTARVSPGTSALPWDLADRHEQGTVP